MTASNVVLFFVVWFAIDVILLVLLIALFRFTVPPLGIQWPRPFTRNPYWTVFLNPERTMLTAKPRQGFGKVFVWHRERFL
ncbi:MAG TPA: hypothetical protein DCS35_11960 [Vibrio sp.]|nr:hypothetical protein [Vibrio sp.]